MGATAMGETAAGGAAAATATAAAAAAAAAGATHVATATARHRHRDCRRRQRGEPPALLPPRGGRRRRHHGTRAATGRARDLRVAAAAVPCPGDVSRGCAERGWQQRVIGRSTLSEPSIGQNQVDLHSRSGLPERQAALPSVAGPARARLVSLPRATVPARRRRAPCTRPRAPPHSPRPQPRREAAPRAPAATDKDGECQSGCPPRAARQPRRAGQWRSARGPDRVWQTGSTGLAAPALTAPPPGAFLCAQMGAEMKTRL